MANIVKIRGSVFAPYAWLEPIKDPTTGKIFEYTGDAREFTPHAVNTMRSRLEQEVIIDFYKKIDFHICKCLYCNCESHKSRWCY